MEEELSSDHISDSESNSSKEALESELYSVLHYTSFSEELPSDLLEKYNIKRNGDNEFFISIKNRQLTDEDDAIIQAPDEVSTLEKLSPKQTDSAVDDTPPSSYEKYFQDVDGDLSKTSCASSEKIEVDKVSTAPPEIFKGTVSVEEDCVVISDTSSESSNDSDVVIQEPVCDIFDISSSSSVECLSTDDNSENMLLNTVYKDKSNIFPPAEGVEEVIEIDWKTVQSPSSWSKEMRIYYNKASKRLKNFDCDKIREEIRGKGTWQINADDMFPRQHRPIKRCSFCRQTDHLVRDCPKRFSNCSMCGYPGHNATNCPSKMCLNCGVPNPIFVPLCRKCELEKNKKCDECHQVGHVKSNCPDTWRRYHLTTTVGELNTAPASLNKNLMCCNCGKAGHLYERCKSLYWSAYPPNSFLVQQYDALPELPHTTGKRKTFNDKVVSLKKQKTLWSDESFFSDQQHYNYTQFNQDTPKQNKKKKKRKQKSPHFKNKRNRGFNYTF